MSAELTAALLELVARGSLVVLAGAAVATALRRASAAARHSVWTATALALLTLPVLTVLGAGLELPILPTVISQAPPLELPAATSSLAPSTVAPEPSVASPGADDATRATRGNRVAGLLALVWMAGFALVAGRFFVGIREARRIAARATPWRREGGTRVLLTDEVGAPVTWGVRRPIILLPRAARHWPAADRRRALLHELAHVERRDWPARVLARLACGLYWFNPLVWWMERLALLEAERAADDRVLLVAGDSQGYAAQLLKLATDLRRPRLALGIHLARKKHLAHRIQAILDPARRRSTMTLAKRLTLATALCLLLAAVSTI